MPRIQPTTADQAPAAAQADLQGIHKQMGRLPNLLGTLGLSPAALKSYLGQKQALSSGTIDEQLGEPIALLVSNANGCAYCVAAHTAIGKSKGMGDDALRAAQSGQAADPKAQAALTFTQALLEREGFGRDEDLAAFTDAGWTPADAIEIVAHVVVNTFTNYVNHLAETDVDFPAVELVGPATA